MANNPFYVNPTASQGFAQGLGQIGQAYGQREKNREMTQNNAQAMSLLNKSLSAQDPQQKQQMFMQAFEMAPDMVRGFMGELRAQRSSSESGPDMPSDIQVAEWYRNATPEQKKAFDQTKRGSKKPIDQQIADAERLASVEISKAQSEAERKLGVQDLSKIAKSANESRKQINTINRMEKLNEKAFSGTGAGIGLQLAKIGNQLGINIEGLTESEQFDAIGNTLVLDKSQEMSGALSNADMTFLQNTVPNLGNTKEGRKQMLEYAKKIQQREVDYARAAQKFRKNNGYFNQAQFDAQYQKFADENSLFGGESGNQDSNQQTPQLSPSAMKYLGGQ